MKYIPIAKKTPKVDRRRVAIYVPIDNSGNLIHRCAATSRDGVLYLAGHLNRADVLNYKIIRFIFTDK